MAPISVQHSSEADVFALKIHITNSPKDWGKRKGKMASESVFDSNKTDTSLTDVKVAMDKINDLLPKKMSTQIFRDVLTGFKILVELLTQEEESVFETVIKWLQLLLRVQSSLDPRNEKLRLQFEKIVPPVVTYIIGCLQHKSLRMPSYHYQLLHMTHVLLDNVKSATVEKLANFESGVVACLWFPMDFVGDFNTQMMALRLLSKLLRCVDGVKQQNELNKIECPQKHLLNEKLSRVIAVSNYHEDLFENTARKLLNNYNMNLAQNVLVYSLRCKTLSFGAKFEFFKTLNADQFWVDFNYCPRSLTFTGRYRAKMQEKFTNVSVECHVQSMRLEEQILLVEFKPPAKFSRKLTNLRELQIISYLKLQLPDEEALRLEENHFVIEYYNKLEGAGYSTDVITNQEMSSEIEETTDCEISFNAINNQQDIQASVDVAVNVPPNQNAGNNNFQKSYEILIGSSGSAQENTAEELQSLSGADNSSATSIAQTIESVQEVSVFKVPSLPKYTSFLHKTKSEKKPVKKCGHSRNVVDFILSQSDAEESPKTSRFSSNVDHSVGLSKATHPIRELREKKRFFKTAKRSWDRDEQSNRSNKISTARRTRQKICKSTNKKAKVSPPKLPKQVNKVKPMNHLDKIVEDIEQMETREASQQSSGIINITNFLDNGNESSAIFNEVIGRTEVQNVARINVATEMPAEAPIEAAVPNSTQISRAAPSSTTDVFEVHDVSDAEPGQSYRNFRSRSLVPNEVPKPARLPRKSVSKKKTKTSKAKRNTDRLQVFNDTDASTSRTATFDSANNASTNIMPAHSTNATEIATNDIEIQQKSQTVASNANSVNKDATVYSADIEIDLTCSISQEDVVVERKRKSANHSNITSGQRALHELAIEQPDCLPFGAESDDESIISDISRNIDTAIDSLYENTDVLQLPVIQEIQECRAEARDTMGSSPVTVLNLVSPDRPTPFDMLRVTEPTFTVTENYNVALSANVPTITELQRYNGMEPLPKRQCLSTQQMGQMSNDEILSEYLATPAKSACNSSVALPKETINFVNDSAVNLTPTMKETTKRALFEADEQLPKKRRIGTNMNQNISNALQATSENVVSEVLSDAMNFSEDECIYHDRSDCNSDSDTESELDTFFAASNSPQSISAVFNTPNRISVKNIASTTITEHQITTAAASIVTRHTRLVSQDIFLAPTNVGHSVSVPACNIVADERRDTTGAYELPAFMQDVTVPSALSTANSARRMDVALRSTSLNRESMGIINTYKNDLIDEYENLLQQTKRKCVGGFVKKAKEITKCILNESEKQREELQELEKVIERLVRQLDWQHETYKEKSEKFNCFRQNINNILHTLSTMNISEDIEREFDQLLEKLQKTSSEKSAKQWRAFVRESTDNLLKNISELSNL